MGPSAKCGFSMQAGKLDLQKGKDIQTKKRSCSIFLMPPLSKRSCLNMILLQMSRCQQGKCWVPKPLPRSRKACLLPRSQQKTLHRLRKLPSLNLLLNLLRNQKLKMRRSQFLPL